MKSKLLLLLLLANFSFYAQTNLVPNGDFENWTPYSQPNEWGRYSNGLLYQDSDAQNGNSSAKVEITSGTFHYFYTDTKFPVETGKTYRVTAYHKLASGSFTSIELRLIDSDIWQTKITGITDNTTSNSQWRKIEFEYVATATRNIGVMIWVTGTTSSQILVDNVSVVDVPQYTQIPDINFENKLISLGIDKDGLNGTISNADIENVIFLDLADSNISNLEGIENFSSLKYLFCERNNLTSIDLSKNIALENVSILENNLTELNVSFNTNLHTLEISQNKISSIDLSQNKKLLRFGCNYNQLTEINLSNNDLTQLNCRGNKLTSLNVTNQPNLDLLECGFNNFNSLDIKTNKKLTELHCDTLELTELNVSENKELLVLNAFGNQLTTLDLSNNTKLTAIYVEFNPLNSLNLQNGNNENFVLASPTSKKNASDIFTSFLNNPNLTCIQVDNIEYSNANWSAIKDPTATYSSTCKSLGTEDLLFYKIVMHPNPTKGEVNIQNVSLEKATVYNALGQLVKSFTLNSANTDHSISLSGLPRGIYYVYLINGDAASAKKVIVE